MNRRRDSIPAELTVRPRWVLWRRETVKARLTKVPYQRSGRRASSTDPRTWASWENIQIAFDRRGYDGVGFVLNGDGIVGVDFDHCYDGSRIAIPKIAEYVAMLDTYCEISASGDGLRLFLFGTLPPQDRKEGDVEVYSDKRFLSVSGRHLAGTPTTINARQAALDAMHAAVFAERTARRTRVRPPQINSIVSQSDADLLDRARSARNGERFARLYDLGQHADFPSQSEADLWLLARLMFWTRGDEARADRLFRGSKLMREKWNCDSYRAHTMERARE
jgi:putative DNA primase/helicase